MKNSIRLGSEFFVALLLFVGALTLLARFTLAADIATTTASTASSTTSVTQSISALSSTSSTVATSSTVPAIPTTFSTSTPVNVTLPNPLLPQIAAIAATSSATSTIISWQTNNEISTGAVLYGTSTDYGATSTSDLALDHSVVLQDLEPETTYHYAISATTGAGTITSPDQTFTTPSALSNPTGSPPTISMVAVVPTYSIATISWTTDQDSSSEVLYGSTSLYATSTTGDSQLAQVPTINHVVTIEDLTPDTTYHFAVVSQNASGLAATSSDLTFTTGLQ